MDKPSIVSIVSQYVQLRRTGKEYKGLCPFHTENTPSFTVNDEKGVFHCFGCGAGGNLIKFLELIEGIDFKEARKRLGMSTNRYGPGQRRSPAIRRAASLLANWMNAQHLLLGVRLRELSAQIAIAQEIPDYGLKENLEREWEVLSDLHDDLQRPKYAAELWAARDAIQTLTADVEPEPLPEFPPWTPAYRAYIATHLPEASSC